MVEDKFKLYNDDCLVRLKLLQANSIDAIVTDPPYHLQSIVSRFKNTSKEDDNITGVRAKTGADGFARLAVGFMGKSWDGGDIAFKVELWNECIRVLKPGGHLLAFGGTRTYHRMACAIEDAGFDIRDQIGWLYGTGFPKSHKVGEGWGTALKPAWEPIVFARKSLEESTVAKNVLEFGTGAINIDECRVEGGRWPANIIHDGSEEVLDEFAKYGNRSAGAPVKGTEPSSVTKDIYGKFNERVPFESYNDEGTAARFFYSAKASSEDREFDNKHPTVKPLALMKYLCRLVTPKGGLVLDPFMGSGSTGKAALQEGFRFVGIEREKEYFDTAKKRIENAIPNTLF